MPLDQTEDQVCAAVTVPAGYPGYPRKPLLPPFGFKIKKARRVARAENPSVTVQTPYFVSVLRIHIVMDFWAMSILLRPKTFPVITPMHSWRMSSYSGVSILFVKSESG